jgi:hypothetical protein
MEGLELGWNQFTNTIEEGTIDGLEMDNDSGGGLATDANEVL